MPQDAIDTAIIHALREDARMPNAALAKRVGLSASACLRRLRMLERDGTIRVTPSCSTHRPPRASS